MTEEEKIYNNKIKLKGIFNFKEFYQFCYDWLQDDTNLIMGEDKYTEKIKGNGNEKEVEIKWTGRREITDYFKYIVKLHFRIINMIDVETERAGQKIATNKGEVEVRITGTLQRDYKGKFERTGFLKFLRSLYEKWVITARIEQMEIELIKDLDEFISQAKSFLALEGQHS